MATTTTTATAMTTTTATPGSPTSPSSSLSSVFSLKRGSGADAQGAVTMHAVIDDEILLGGFHDFVTRFHAEETLMFWMSVEVFRHRNWKAAKFFGMDEDKVKEKASAPSMPKPKPRKLSIIGRTISRKLSKKEMLGVEAGASAPSAAAVPTPRSLQEKQEAAARSHMLQRKLDEQAAARMGITLEQLYLVKEADFIFENFLQRGCPYWICVDQKVADKVEEKLQTPSRVTREVFSEAQALAWAGMSEDLLPRFVREIVSAGDGKPGSLKLTSQLAALKIRIDEIKGAPLRRKTGVSTALAFSFRQRTVSRTEREVRATAPAVAKDHGKAASLLRTYSSMAMLSVDAGSVSTLALSRNRLSQRSTHSAAPSTLGVGRDGSPTPPPPSSSAVGPGAGGSRVPSGASSKKGGPLAYATGAHARDQEKHSSMPVAAVGTPLRASGRFSVRPRSKSDSAVARSKATNLNPVPRRTALILSFDTLGPSVQRDRVDSA